MGAIPPAGVTPLSAYTVHRSEATQRPQPVLADAIDARTGELTSLLRGVGVADGMVTTLMRTKRSSGASVVGLGHTLDDVEHVDAQSPVLVESLVREALQPAADAGVLELVSARSEPEPRDRTQLRTEVEFRDLLRSGSTQSRSF